MRTAVAAVASGRTSLRDASKQFNVPRTTLTRRCRNLVDQDAPAHKRTVLTKAEEDRLAQWCLERESRLFGVTPQLVCETAYAIVEKSGRPHQFNKIAKRAGYDWLKQFYKRHPQLTTRKPEALSAARARAMNEVVVERYFKLLATTLTELQLNDKPAQIFNADETGLSSVHKPPKIIGQKGKKQVHSKTSAERGFNTSVLACANAVGSFVPPFVIFKGQTTASHVMTADEIIQEMKTKQAQEELRAEEKQQKKRERDRKAADRKKMAEEKKKAREEKKQQRQEKGKGKQIAKKPRPPTPSYEGSDSEEEDMDEEDNTFCAKCNAPWMADEPWVSCRGCKEWFHEDCTGWQGDMNLFICTDCRDLYDLASGSD
ncbi:uncharacterized protein LOC110985790 [Acanthaster planci]|uniref:Uncharacterized protein LOC110985790 n=1 Tax=Acanthaster planci TaxID=133434 RepID=A0A8B7ZHR1_ACAPL|nr:uncharacterized protein LOC110985790 [Acanthaster planci]